MNTNSTIDDLFKDGLNDMNFSNRGAMWKKMEKELDDKKRKKKRATFILLLCCLIAGGFFIAKNSSRSNITLISTKLADQQKTKVPLKESNNVFAVGCAIPLASKPAAATSVITHQFEAGSAKKNSAKRNDIISTASGMAINTEEAIISERIMADFNSLSSAQSYNIDNTFKLDPAKMVISKPLVKNTEIRQKKISLEIVAGSDIFSLNKKVGYYTGVRISKNLDKGTSVSVGINYSFNTLNEKYRLSKKPLQQQEMDAQINNLKMLRFPLLFQRQIPKTKFALMAGLVPSYILAASVYNVPNSNTGNPAEYRRFTLDEIHRFNILFGAGIKYSPFKKISFELSGSYGFTSMVKDSYINQSNVNDNFKNIQAGAVLRLK